MIKILDKHNCCGCSACVQICPKQCVNFEEDEQGFRYPLINKELCIDCGLCEKVCPCLNQSEPRKPINVYAAINPNEEIRMKSSSGGIFSLLAEKIIDEGGVVFGARFDENWEVIHDFSESKDGFEVFRGSKYVQSRIGGTYKQAKEFLDKGRKVLFSGTSCQIAGLKKFLRKEYDNLLTVDVVCHGVPSPLIWREYLKELIERPKGIVEKKTVLLSLKEKPVITSISFRDKTDGWKKYGFVICGKSACKADKKILHETLDQNFFMQLFLKNLSLRPSCFYCPARTGKSESDITIADFWRVEEFLSELNDDKGVSLAMAGSNKGLSVLQDLNVELTPVSYEIAKTVNLCVEKSVEEPGEYESFWNTYLNRGISALNKFSRNNRDSLKTKIYKLYKKLMPGL